MVVLIAVCLAVHVAFLVWVFWFLWQRNKYLNEQERRWKKDRDERQRYPNEQEQESERRIQELRDATEQLRRTLDPGPT